MPTSHARFKVATPSNGPRMGPRALAPSSVDANASSPASSSRRRVSSTNQRIHIAENVDNVAAAHPRAAPAGPSTPKAIASSNQSWAPKAAPSFFWSPTKKHGQPGKPTSMSIKPAFVAMNLFSVSLPLSLSLETPNNYRVLYVPNFSFSDILLPAEGVGAQPRPRGTTNGTHPIE